jgi:hypothetical protein
MTWVREDATGTRPSLRAASARSPRHLWRRSRSTGATVDLDHDLVPVRFITHRVGEGIDRRELVHADPKPGGLGEPADPRPLSSRGPDRVGEEDVVDPAAAKTSASPTLPAVIPTAPASTWRLPISTHLCVLTCGLTSRLCWAAKPCMRSMLACMTSISTIDAGVSTRPTSVSSARWSTFTLHSS